MGSTTAKAAQDVLAADFQTLVRDAEKLLEHTATLAGDQADILRAEVNASLARARAALKEQQRALREQGQLAAAAAEDYIQAKPLHAIGLAAGVGFLVGLLATRR